MGSPLDALLQSYGRLPVPSRQEQVILGRAVRAWLDWKPSPAEAPPRIRRAGERAREALISRNMLLVCRQARSFTVRSMPALDVQDLIQEGAFGLARAAELFDPEHGFAFSTFAVWWIRQSMTRLVHTSGGIRIPTKRSQAMHKLKQWSETFFVQECRFPTDAEIMNALGHSPGDLAILRETAVVYHVRSLDALMADEDGDSWLSTVAAPADDPDNSNRRFDHVVAMLGPWPVLQEVMQRRLLGQSYPEISREMGIGVRVARRRGREAVSMAQWLMQSEKTEDEQELKELTTAIDTHVKPTVFWQPSLGSLLG